MFHCNNTLSTQDYLKDFVNEKANNSNYVDLEVHSLDNSNYQDGDVINFLNLKYKIISDSEKKYLVFRTFEKFSNDDKKILSLSNSLNEQINYLFVGLVKK